MIVALSLWLALVASPTTAVGQSWSLPSPNGRILLHVALGEAGGPGMPQEKQQLYYWVEHGTKGHRATVLERAPLGLQVEGAQFLRELRCESTEPQRPVAADYIMPHGKRRLCHNRGNQLTLTFANPEGRHLEMDFRAYDDGVAFRYRLPADAVRFLKDVPVAWDDTRFIAGYPGQFAILARRKGDTWYIAGVNGQAQPRREIIRLDDRFGEGLRRVTLLTDGDNARAVVCDTRTINLREGFTATMLPRGGFLAVLKAIR